MISRKCTNGDYADNWLADELTKDKVTFAPTAKLWCVVCINLWQEVSYYEENMLYVEIS